jgi:hypothetical protein
MWIVSDRQTDRENVAETDSDNFRQTDQQTTDLTNYSVLILKAIICEIHHNPRLIGGFWRRAKIRHISSDTVTTSWRVI